MKMCKSRNALVALEDVGDRLCSGMNFLWISSMPGSWPAGSIFIKVADINDKSSHWNTFFMCPDGSIAIGDFEDFSSYDFITF